MAVKAVIGLGNPGAPYAGHRHNVGYRVVDELAGALSAGPWAPECRSLVCRAEFREGGVLLVKPAAFMNRSGEAVRQLLQEHGLGPPEIVVVVDDFNLPFGRIRIRTRGSAGGHNGLESLIRFLETREFVRVRLGIGEDGMPADRADFVLRDFPPERGEGLKEMISAAGNAVRMILTEGVARAMSVFNA